MKRYYNILFMAMLLFTMIVALPQYGWCKSKSKNIKPEWISTQPRPQNDSYYFKVVEVDNGKNLNSSKKLSQKELVNSIKREFNIKITEGLESISITDHDNSNSQYSGREVYTLKIDSDDSNVNIYYEKIAEYYETFSVDGRSVFKLYTLYAVSHSTKVICFDNFHITPKYGANGLWRSAIVPGWGQFHKGSKVKGGVMLGGTVAFAVGIILTESQRSDYMSKIYQTQNADNIRTYKTKADNMATARNVCIGGVAALYIYNLIDAVVAPGAERVIVRKNNKFTQRVALVPVLSNQMNGVLISYKF